MPLYDCKLETNPCLDLAIVKIIMQSQPCPPLGNFPEALSTKMCRQILDQQKLDKLDLAVVRQEQRTRSSVALQESRRGTKESLAQKSWQPLRQNTSSYCLPVAWLRLECRQWCRWYQDRQNCQQSRYYHQCYGNQLCIFTGKSGSRNSPCQFRMLHHPGN